MDLSQFGFTEVVWIASIGAVIYILIQRHASRKVERALKEEVRRARQEALGSRAEPSEDSQGGEEDQTGLVPQVDSELVAACVDGKCVLFAGAGLGVPAGFPTWRQLLSRVVDKLEKKDPYSEWQELRSMLAEGNESEVADILKSRSFREYETSIHLQSSESSQDGVLDIWQNAATGPTVYDIPETLGVLREVPFRAVVSTTWDGLVNHAFRFKEYSTLTSRSSIDLSKVLRKESGFILKPYGVLNDPKSLLFTYDDYKDSVEENDAYAKFIGSLCATNSFLFIGTSLDTIEHFFEDSRIRQSPGHYHYALVPAHESSSLAEERLLAKYNVKVSVFRPTAEWEEVTIFARNLSDSVKATSTEKARPPVKPQVLEKIILTNIGPFTRLDLELSPKWTILLGDNGCGKSTILRSIALALAGDDDRVHEAATSLLRAGSESGLIELYIGNSVYRTKLIRQGNRVRARSDSFTPVQGGTWLVLGFPSLRGSATRKLEGARGASQTTMPSVDDLLPLLNNDVDGRFDELRQWLLNTIISAERGEKDNLGAQKLRDSFLDAMRKLTPGTPLRKLTYQDDPWDVLIDTDDGAIPVALMSQGMSSVFAWVGTLLRRLGEVYPGEPDANLKQCLVLNDEIGAHLHPGWQGEILSLIRGDADLHDKNVLHEETDEIREAIFPNLQVIATTHSPLIVANAKAGEVFYLRRPDPEELKGSSKCQPTVTRIEHSFEGWRADQILTAPAFGMDYARDRRTRLKLQRYERLFSKPERTEKEQHDMEALAKSLDETVLPRQETEEKRQGKQVASDWMKQQLSELPEDKKEKVMLEAQKYLAELEGSSE